MTDVEHVPVPRIGVLHRFTTTAGNQVGVLHRRDGSRELLFYEDADRDTVVAALALTEREATDLGRLLGAIGERLQLLEISREPIGSTVFLLRRAAPS